MQDSREDGSYGMPESLDYEKMTEMLGNRKTKRVLVFQSKNRNGRPTKEMRRAWRRYNKSKQQ